MIQIKTIKKISKDRRGNDAYIFREIRVAKDYPREGVVRYTLDDYNGDYQLFKTPNSSIL